MTPSVEAVVFQYVLREVVELGTWSLMVIGTEFSPIPS